MITGKMVVHGKTDESDYTIVVSSGSGESPDRWLEPTTPAYGRERSGAIPEPTVQSGWEKMREVYRRASVLRLVRDVCEK